MSFDEAPSSPSSSLGIHSDLSERVNSFRASLKTFSDALTNLKGAHVAAHTAELAAVICNDYAREAQEWVNWLKHGQVEWRVSMSKLKESAKDRNDKERELEQSITYLVKTMYRLSGKTVYEPTTPEFDSVVKGKG